MYKYVLVNEDLPLFGHDNKSQPVYEKNGFLYRRYAHNNPSGFSITLYLPVIDFSVIKEEDAKTFSLHFANYASVAKGDTIEERMNSFLKTFDNFLDSVKYCFNTCESVRKDEPLFNAEFSLIYKKIEKSMYQNNKIFEPSYFEEYHSLFRKEITRLGDLLSPEIRSRNMVANLNEMTYNVFTIMCDGDIPTSPVTYIKDNYRFAHEDIKTGKLIFTTPSSVLNQDVGQNK